MVGLRFLLTFCLAWIVMISDDTYREGLNNVGDIVSILDDGRIANPTSLWMFNIKNFKGSAANIRIMLNSKMPEIIEDVKTHELLWFNTVDGKYYKINKQPKYQYTTDGLIGDWKIDDIKATVKEYPENWTTSMLTP